MSWIEKAKPSPLDDKPIAGLYFLDGDQVARVVQRDWTKGYKLPLVVFPTHAEYEVWPTGNPEQVAIVHLFGEMDLPLGDTRDRAFEEAFDIAEQCGYMLRKVGEDSIELWGNDSDEHLLVVYDDAVKRMKNVIQIENEPSPIPARRIGLLDEKSREALPALYANEEKGLEAPALVKFFTPDSNWTWYASEFDGKDTFFGLVSGFEVEFGYFTLSELEAARGPLGLPIERDRDFESRSLRELRDQHQQERRRGA